MRKTEFSMGWLLAVYAGISAVYLLYLPHSLPLSDDWVWLSAFRKARAASASAQLELVRQILENRVLGYFRILWAGYTAAFGVSYLADFSTSGYFLFGWAVHAATAALLARLVLLLTGDARAAFGAGALYVVFPAANHALFWTVNSYPLYLQVLVFCMWFGTAWRRIAAQDFRFGWADVAWTAAVALSGEQIFAAFLLLPPVTYALWGERRYWGPFLRFWLLGCGTALAVLVFYALWINRAPIGSGVQMRYALTHVWNPVLAGHLLLATLGLAPELAQWRPRWTGEPWLLAALALSGAAFWWLASRLGRGETPASRRQSEKLLLWSLAGALLTYLPVAPLGGFELRYLYVPATFLAPAAMALLGLLAGRLSLALAFVAVSYAVALTYFEMRQCWIPQSRSARALLETIAASRPVHSGEYFVLAGDHGRIGLAPSFITSASWSLNVALAHAGGAEGVEGGRDLVVHRSGLALSRPDSLVPVRREELHRLRVFVFDAPSERYLTRSVVAWPTGDGKLEMLPLRLHRVEIPESSRIVTPEEARRLPFASEIYFARHRPGSAHPAEGR